MNPKPDQQSALSLGYSNTPPKLDEVTLAWESATPCLSTETNLILKFAMRNYPHTPEQIAQEIRVDDDGNLWWKNRKKGRKFYDKPLGYCNRSGYLITQLDYQMYLNHTLCFCLYHGRWPKYGMVLDHINEVRTDNRKENLDEVTQSQNLLRPIRSFSNSKSGYRNISFNKRDNVWRVEFCVRGYKVNKSYKSLNDAILYRDSFKEHLL